MKHIQIESDYAFRWRTVGLESWNQVTAGSRVDIAIEDGTSIELGSVVDNGTLKFYGSIGEINILASKLTNLVASFTNIREMSKLEINSESEVTDEERMINKTRITDDLYIRFTSENKNARYYFADVEGVDRELSINGKDGYSRLNLVALSIDDKFPIHDDIKEISSDKLDLRNVTNIESLDGSNVSALDKFGVSTRDGRVLPSVYHEVFTEQVDDSKTIELSLGINTLGETIYRDDTDSVSFDAPNETKTLEVDLGINKLGDAVFRDDIEDASFDALDDSKTIELSLGINTLGETIYRDGNIEEFEEPDNNKTFEINLGVKSASESVYRDEFDDSLVFNDTSDTINYTFEMDLYAQGALTDVDGNAFSAENPMDLTQLPA